MHLCMFVCCNILYICNIACQYENSASQYVLDWLRVIEALFFVSKDIIITARCPQCPLLLEMRYYLFSIILWSEIDLQSCIPFCRANCSDMLQFIDLCACMSPCADVTFGFAREETRVREFVGSASVCLVVFNPGPNRQLNTTVTVMVAILPITAGKFSVMLCTF